MALRNPYSSGRRMRRQGSTYCSSARVPKEKHENGDKRGNKENGDKRGNKETRPPTVARTSGGASLFAIHGAAIEVLVAVVETTLLVQSHDDRLSTTSCVSMVKRSESSISVVLEPVRLFRKTPSDPFRATFFPP
jgi:hypothetical protein